MDIKRMLELSGASTTTKSAQVLIESTKGDLEHHLDALVKAAYVTVGNSETATISKYQLKEAVQITYFDAAKASSQAKQLAEGKADGHLARAIASAWTNRDKNMDEHISRQLSEEIVKNEARLLTEAENTVQQKAAMRKLDEDLTSVITQMSKLSTATPELRAAGAKLQEASDVVERFC